MIAAARPRTVVVAVAVMLRYWVAVAVG
jgi:hypothetical protein